MRRSRCSLAVLVRLVGGGDRGLGGLRRRGGLGGLGGLGLLATRPRGACLLAGAGGGGHLLLGGGGRRGGVGGGVARGRALALGGGGLLRHAVADVRVLDLLAPAGADVAGRRSG